MSIYLCYDLKGIQQYIFQIPKLTCCIGGSRQIDDFDRNVAGKCSVNGVRLIYSGGGKGAFECDSENSLAQWKNQLVENAFKKGLTIRFGIDSDYSTAAREIRETFCYQPDSLEGQPCRLSGLYPVADGNIHPLIANREKLGRQHGEKSPTEAKFLNIIQERCNRGNLSFFYNVSADDGDDGAQGARALGSRNRWAVICMDGNDMNMQFLTFKEQNHSNAQWQEWLPEMSRRLDECTCNAAAEGMCAVAEKYLEENPGATVLPLRPLIVGGDDVTVLVSCKYALLFVKTVMQTFNAESRKFAPLWVGTGGELTISAGILFAPVTLPLHSALAYTETLLAGAKTHGRTLKKDSKQASPPCLDWENVTESMLLSPAERRQKEFLFEDEETGNVIELSARPYSLDEFAEVEKVKSFFIDRKIPSTICYQLHPALQKSKPERMAFYAKLKKNHPELAAKLYEPLPGSKTNFGSWSWWRISDKTQTTCVIDALLLIQEEKRMTQNTAALRETSEND